MRASPRFQQSKAAAAKALPRGKRVMPMLVMAIVLIAITVLASSGYGLDAGQKTFTGFKTESGQWGYKSNSDEVAYCLDGQKAGPDGATYAACSEKATGAAGYIAFHGYPRTTSICGRDLTPNEARMATQWALWIHGGFLTRSGLTAKANAAEGYPAGARWLPWHQSRKEVRDAALALLDEAEAWERAGSDGSESEYAIVYQPTGAGDRQRILLAPNTGSIELRKQSAAPGVTRDNPNYSLGQASYLVYLDESCTHRARDIFGREVDITTDESGRGRADDLQEGTYYVKEAGSPRGFALSPEIHRVTVTRDDVSTVEGKVEDNPETAMATVQKLDQDGVALGSDAVAASAQGNASLEGALFELSFYASADGRREGRPTRVWTFQTDEKGVATFDEAHFSSGDELYRNASGKIVLPLGSYSVREVAAPSGYQLSDADSHPFDIVQENGVAKVKSDSWNVPQAKGAEGRAISDRVLRAGICVRKEDTEHGRAQGDASLAGISFDIVNKSRGAVVVDGNVYQPGDRIEGRLVTDESGRASTACDLLPVGTYEVVEAASNESMRLGGEGKTVTIAPSDVGRLVEVDSAFSDEVKRGGMSVRKVDLETEANRPLGAASLDGAHFSVRNASDAPVVVGGKAYAPGETIDKAELVTDDKGAAQTAGDLLPYGTYEVWESAAPRGYLLSDEKCRATRQTVMLREDGAIVSQPEGPTKDQVIRGDIAFTKKEAGSMRPLAGCAFKITSLTTGESHVVVADQNGMVDTSAGWVPHTRDTNKNDAADNQDGSADESKGTPNAGVWFSGTKDGEARPDDSLGALPFDSYEVDELTGPSNEGTSQVSFTVTITRDDVKVDLGTIDDEPLPRLETVARGDLGPKTSAASAEAKLVDTIYYDNVKPNSRYTAVATLMDKRTGKMVTCDDGSAVEGRCTFSTNAPYGTAEVDIPVDATGLGERDLVIFETLLDNRGRRVAIHNDPDNADQTISIQPTISTKASDGADGNHEVPSAGAQTIDDEVSYSGLIPGEKYVISGCLMDGRTGQPLLDADGNRLTSEVSLAPVEPTGKARVSFHLEGEQGQTDSIVVFERLTRGDEVVATHEDLSDESQTIKVPRIETSASNAPDGTSQNQAGDNPTVTDRVTYTGLEPNATYMLTGRLVDKDNGQELTDPNGRTLEAELEFTPEEASGTVSLSFSAPRETLTGRRAVAFEKLERDGVVLASHEDLDSEEQSVSFPELQTEACETEDDSHFAGSEAPCQIRDVVTYSGLTPGATYVVRGSLRQGGTGEALPEGSGQAVESQAEFVPETPSGSVEVAFDVDGSKLKGKAVVAFEELWAGDRKVAEHADANDKAQSVHFARMATRAFDKADGDSAVDAGRAELADEVSYENLVAGQEYKLSGTLMDKETGQPARDAEGSEIRGEATFTPHEASGTAEVTCKADLATLDGHELVFFESLTKGDVEIASHKDIEDREQTVRVEKRKGAAMPQTGVMSLAAVAIAIGVALLIVQGLAKPRSGTRHE